MKQSNLAQSMLNKGICFNNTTKVNTLLGQWHRSRHIIIKKDVETEKAVWKSVLTI